MNLMKRHLPSRIEVWYPLIILAAGWLAYSNSFACPFLFDDAGVITDNPHIFHLWPPWKAVLAPTRFVADYSFALNHTWAGFSPAEYRLVNILIHLGSGLALYGIMRRTLRLPCWHSRLEQNANELALTTALIWTVHPLQTESVTYIAQRIESLMGLFFLLTFYAFIRGATAGSRFLWKPAAVIFCALGMATKEVMITAPVLLLVYDGLFISDSWRGPLKRWRWHATLFATWSIVLLLLRASLLQAQAEHVPLVGAGAVRWEYALTQLNVLIHYLKLSVVPYPLCFDYRWPLVESPFDALWPGILTILFALGTLWALWKRTWIGFVGAWFFVILAPTSSLNPLPDAAFEHRMYLPLAGVIAGLVGLVAAGIHHSRLPTRTQRVAGFLLLITVAGLFTTLTLARNRLYLTEEGMWRDVIKRRPENYRSYISLSSALLDKEQYAESSTLCSNLLSRLPPFEKVSRDEIERTHYHPGRPPVHMYYAMAHNNLGLVAMALNQSAQAKQHYQEALRVFPAGFWAHRNLGLAFYLETRVDEAVTEWNQASAWNPKDSRTHAYLGLALSGKGQYKAAEGHYREAVRLKEDFLFARSQWAWLLATCPSHDVRDGQLALSVALPLLEGSAGSSSRALDVVAAAYAETGDFSNAVRYAQEALSVAGEPPANPSHSTGEISRDYTTEDLRYRLDLYRKQTPCRSPK